MPDTLRRAGIAAERARVFEMRAAVARIKGWWSCETYGDAAVNVEGAR
jgi:hypothetical protein